MFSFYSSCRELQSWLEKQTALFQTLQPQGDNLEVTQLKYEVSHGGNGDQIFHHSGIASWFCPSHHIYSGPLWAGSKALGLTLGLVTQSERDVVEPSIPRSFVTQKGYGEKEEPAFQRSGSSSSFSSSASSSSSECSHDLGHWKKTLGGGHQSC